MSKKLLIAIALAGFSLALSVRSGIAQADDGQVSFGIRPTRASEHRPQTFSYFSYELAPGAVLTDEALVMNSGDVPVTLKLYAADGITAINGGTAFAQQGQESTGASRGVNRWLSLSVTEIALEPGEERVVPFTITVPSDASPGHHVAGLVLEAPPTEGGEGQFVVKVVQQAGVAVVIEVPGRHIAGLELSGASLRQQDDQGATFVIAVHNTGNIFLKGEGSLRIMDRNDEVLASIPLRMDTVLPGDEPTFQVTHPVHLADGDYLLAVVLNYEGKTAVLEGAEIEVRDGQPAVEGEPQEGLLPSLIAEIGGGPWEESELPMIGWFAIGAAALLIPVEVALVYSLLRKRHRTRRG